MVAYAARLGQPECTCRVLIV